ncbi:MAG: twitching motility protein [Deltaproteobacteria bacterium]|nr:MAG: twitching motility protein [Deltaproteobacteria bacterium]RUA01618.1 MAG: twitching motility protein [Deltaproteobacteria bacterium]
MRRQEIDYVLNRMLDTFKDVSDLNITVGKPFQVEVSGKLREVPMDPPIKALTPFQTETMALNLIDQDPRLTRDLINNGSCDLSYELSGKARFRVSIFSQMGNTSIVLRRLETRIPTLDVPMVGSPRLPDSFRQIAKEKNGIVLVTGATGSGKTTSLAAVLNEINESQSVHIITLEDPVEYRHPHKQSTFNQREMGTDFTSFSHGLRAALRQAPKVILVGEMRDRETVEIALRAAETGHLVLSTLHTVDAGQTINRILGMFNIEEENQIRIRLADLVRWVVSQRLLPKIGGGRVAAFEVMGTNLRIKDIIRHGETEDKTFFNVIEQGKAFGMVTFDDYIVRLFEKGIITEETARAYATRKGVTGRGIDTVKSRRGESTTDIKDLEVDVGYGREMESDLF